MSKVVNIGGYLVGLDSIVAIKEYHNTTREYIGDKGKIWFPLCLFKKEYWDGKPVEYGLFGGRFIETGTRRGMLVYFDKANSIDIDYDEEIVSQWIAYKNSK